MAIGWKLHGDGKTLAPGEVVAPDERLSLGHDGRPRARSTWSRCSARRSCSR